MSTNCRHWIIYKKKNNINSYINLILIFELYTDLKLPVIKIHLKSEKHINYEAFDTSRNEELVLTLCTQIYVPSAVNSVVRRWLHKCVVTMRSISNPKWLPLISSYLDFFFSNANNILFLNYYQWHYDYYNVLKILTAISVKRGKG